jgi:hypothetical protein
MPPRFVILSLIATAFSGCGGRVEPMPASSGGTAGGAQGGTGGDGMAAMAGAGMAGTAPCAPLTVIATDISAGQGPDSGYSPSAVVDAANSKLLVVTSNGANSFKASLFRCNLDGTACTHTDISAGQGTDSGYYPSAVIDAANSKLLVVTSNGANSFKPSLFRCNLDGTACTHTDISAGQGIDSGFYLSAVIDAANSKLLVATDNQANSGKPSLFRCNLDGTACTHTDISAGQGIDSGFYLSAVIDAANRKLVVVTENDANSGKPSLFRCNLDGTACTHTDVSAGQGPYSGFSPSAVIDASNRKLLVVTENRANSFKPSLFRCNLDGTACTHTDISAGQGFGSGFHPSAVIDTVNSKLLVVTENDANSYKPSLFRCNLDGTACTHTDISAGQGFGSGHWPSAVLDPSKDALRVVTSNSANSSVPWLFSVCLR